MSASASENLDFCSLQCTATLNYLHESLNRTSNTSNILSLHDALRLKNFEQVKDYVQAIMPRQLSFKQNSIIEIGQV